MNQKPNVIRICQEHVMQCMMLRSQNKHAHMVDVHEYTLKLGTGVCEKYDHQDNIHKQYIALL